MADDEVKGTPTASDGDGMDPAAVSAPARRRRRWGRRQQIFAPRPI
jgi:hypothetical protein